MHLIVGPQDFVIDHLPLDVPLLGLVLPKYAQRRLFLLNMRELIPHLLNESLSPRTQLTIDLDSTFAHELDLGILEFRLPGVVNAFIFKALALLTVVFSMGALLLKGLPEKHQLGLILHLLLL